MAVRSVHGWTGGRFDPEIAASESRAGSDRVTRMRFEFEMGDPSHLDSVLRTIKQIDNVYDAYRLVPGKGT